MATATQLLRIIIKADNQASGELDKLGKKSKSLSDNFRSVGASMTRNLTLPILGLGVIMAKPFIEFDKQLINFEARTGSTADQMEIIRAKALELGRDTAFSPSSAMEGMLELAASGQTVEETLLSIEPILNLASAGMLNLKVASDGVTDVMEALGLEVKDTTRVVDGLVGASQRSSATVQNMIDAWGNGAQAMRNFGISFEEGNAALAVLAENGIKASEAGTAMKSMIIAMTRQTPRAIAAWELLGTTWKDASGNIKDVNTIILDINKGLDGLSQADRLVVITELAGSFGQAGLNALLAAGGISEMEASIASAQTASEVAAKQQESFAGSLNQLRGSFERLSILVIGPFMKEVLVPLIKKATEIANKFGTWSEDNEELSSKIVKVVAGLALMGPAISLIGFALIPLINAWKLAKAVMLAWRAAALAIVPLTQAMSGGFSLAAAAQWALNAAMLAAPYILVVAAIVAVGIAILALIDHFGGLKNIAAGVTDFLQLSLDGWKLIIKRLGDHLRNGIKNLANIGKAMGRIGFGLVKAFAMGMFNAVRFVMQAASDVANSVLDTIKGVFGIASPSTAMVEIGEDLGNGLSIGYINGVQVFVKTAVPTAAVQITDAVRTNMRGVGEDSGRELVRGYVKGVEVWVSQAIDTNAQATAQIGDAVRTNMRTAGEESGRELVRGFENGVEVWISQAKDTTNNLTNQIGDAARTNLGVAGEKSGNSFVEGAFKTIRVGGREIRVALGGMAQDAVSQMGQAGVAAGNAFNLGVNSSMRQLGGNRRGAAALRGTSRGATSGGLLAGGAGQTGISQAARAFIRRFAPTLERKQEAIQQGRLDAGTRFGSFTVENINVPEGTTQEQIDFILAEIARRTQGQGI